MSSGRVLAYEAICLVCRKRSFKVSSVKSCRLERSIITVIMVITVIVYDLGFHVFLFFLVFFLASIVYTNLSKQVNPPPGDRTDDNHDNHDNADIMNMMNVEDIFDWLN